MLAVRSIQYAAMPQSEARVLMDAARDLAEWHVRAALILQRASTTVVLAGSIDDGVGLRDVIRRVSGTGAVIRPLYAR
jgi:hypothetical protein